MTASRQLAEWQAMLPGADVHLAKLIVTPWQACVGALDLTLEKQRQQLRYQGENLHADRPAARHQ